MHVRPTLNGRVSRCFRQPGIGIRENWFIMGSLDQDQHAPLFFDTRNDQASQKAMAPSSVAMEVYRWRRPIVHAAATQNGLPWESNELPMDDLLLSIHHS
jgi:hypothetical protein